MLDGAPLPANASIRDFRGRKVDYVADVVEQALLLLKDMANLRSQMRHEVFLSLKRDLAMVSLSICPLFFFTIFIPFLPFTMFLSSAGYSSYIPGIRDNKFLPPLDEGRRRKAQCHHGDLQSDRKKNK